jgi:hypothetical protein
VREEELKQTKGGGTWVEKILKIVHVVRKRGEANPSRGENPEDKSWSSRTGLDIGLATQFFFGGGTKFVMKSQSSIAGWNSEIH